jgi:endonuclease G
MRNDIEEAESPRVAQALKGRRRVLRAEAAPVVQAAEALLNVQDKPERVELRRSLVEPKDRDPNGLERVIGASDLCSINFLARGIQAAAGVARLRVRLKSGSGEWFGTGRPACSSPITTCCRPRTRPRWPSPSSSTSMT